MDAPILVTGATGYVGSHLVNALLQNGLTVRGTVRDKKSGKCDFLWALEGARERLQLVDADLNEEEGWDQAVKGCEVVHHVASPYIMTVKDPQRDLIDPAVEGTKRVLRACANSGVRRVVLTSSMNAMGATPHKVFDESDWNTFASLKKMPFSYSKTLQEKAAWEFQAELPDEQRFELVVLNPGLVLGPALNNVVGESARILRDFTDKKKSPFVVKMGFYIVDVRDVAEAHILAQTSLDAPNKRFCLTNESLWLIDIADLLRERFPDYRFPKLSKIPSWGFKMMSYGMKGDMAHMTRFGVGKLFQADNTRIQSELGVRFTDWKATIIDTFQSFIDKGLVRKSGGPDELNLAISGVREYMDVLSAESGGDNWGPVGEVAERVFDEHTFFQINGVCMDRAEWLSCEREFARQQKVTFSQVSLAETAPLTAEWKFVGVVEDGRGYMAQGVVTVQDDRIRQVTLDFTGDAAPDVQGSPAGRSAKRTKKR